MKVFKIIILIFCLSFGCNASGQLLDLKGKVKGVGNVDGLHVLNKTALKYSVTDENGVFVIPAKVNDSIVFSGLTYKIKEIRVTKEMISKNNIEVVLIENITQLDEINVGKILTGNIGSDLRNLDIRESINFYDLNIPGYTGKPKTIEERKLADADAGNWGYVGLGFGVNFHKILNKISGRTKRLKARVDLDEKDKCMKRLKAYYTESIFEKEVLTEAQQSDYFYFCMDDQKFKALCEQNNPIEVISFLNQKLVDYKINLNTKDD